MNSMVPFAGHPADYLKLQTEEIERQVAHQQLLRALRPHSTTVLTRIGAALQALFRPTNRVNADRNCPANQACCPRTVACCG